MAKSSPQRIEMPQTDLITRVMFESVSARAHLIQLGPQWQEISRRHAEAPEVISLLGQMTAASVLLSASLKYEGSVILQIHGDGPVRLAVAECDAEMAFRSTVKTSDTESISPGSSWRTLVNQHNMGRFSVVLDPKVPNQHPYQGIVPLHEEGLAQALESYMDRSEQLPTRLWLACNGQACAGLLLQRMPNEGGHQAAGSSDEDWSRLVTLASTITSEELLSTDAQTLLHRLFWEEKPRLLDERPTQFACHCSHERVSRMLRALGPDEVNSILGEQHVVEVNCDFCNASYTFDEIDCAQLFNDQDPSISPGSQTLQ